MIDGWTSTDPILRISPENFFLAYKIQKKKKKLFLKLIKTKIYIFSKWLELHIYLRTATSSRVYKLNKINLSVRVCITVL